MQYTNLENKLIGIRKMQSKVKGCIYLAKLRVARVEFESRLRSSKQYFFKNN